MKRLFISKILFFMFLCILLFDNVGDYYATTAAGTGAGGFGAGGTACNSGNCRLFGTGGVRIALLDNNNNKVAVKDYYYYGGGLGWVVATYDSRNFSFKDKYLKQEIINLSEDKLAESLAFTAIVGITSDGKTSIEDIMPGILSGFTNFFNYGGYNSSLNTIIPSSTEYIINRIVDNSTPDNMGNPKYGRGELHQYINNLLADLCSNCDNGKPWTIDTIDTGYHFQLEPIIQARSKKNGLGLGFIGTYAELFKFQSNPIYVDNYNTIGGYFFDGALLDEMRTSVTFGIVATDKQVIPNGLFEEASYSSFNRSNYLSSPKKAYGVGFISLDRYRKDCDSQLRSLIKKYEEDGNKSNFNNEVKKLSGIDAKSRNNLLNDGYKKIYGMNSSNATCNPSKKNNLCKIVYNSFKTYDEKKNFRNNVSKYYDFNKSKTQIYGADAVNKYVINDTADNVCSIFSCDDILPVIEKESNGNGSLGGFDTRIKALHDNFYKYNLLTEEMYKSEELNSDLKPKCDGIIIPDCNASSSGDCSKSNNKIIFSTDTKEEECIRSNFSYISKDNIVTSKNAFYSSLVGEDIFCSEKVTFDFPGSPKIAKSGTLLKWGKNFTDNNAEFGSMQIVQNCYYTDNPSNETSQNVNLYWNENLINTKVTLLYSDPNNTPEYNLKNDLITYFVRDEKFEPNHKNVTLNTNSGNSKIFQIGKGMKSFKVTANYKFLYDLGNLSWYSGNGSNISNLFTYDNRKNGRGELTYIGYGLPTSFNALSGTYKNKMSAIITNIGTTMNNGESKFKKYVKYELNSGLSEEYTYSCDYNIYNELFGYECSDENGKIYDNAPDYCKGINVPKKTIKDIDVVFRTIDLIDNNGVDNQVKLNRSFPGRSGKGINSERKKGSNWSLPNVEDEYILSVLDNKIYDEEPMYHFTLDVTLIKSIRAANDKIKDSGWDPYTSWESPGQELTAFMGFVCNNNSDKKYCVSHFISYLASGSLGRTRVGGKCLDRTTLNRINDTERVLAGPCGQEWWSGNYWPASKPEGTANDNSM